MRVLITGAAGFVGQWLAAELLAAGDRVFGLIRPGDGPAPEGTTAVEADIRDPSALECALAVSDPEAVYHLAALSSAALLDRDALIEANVQGTRHVIDAAAGLGHPVRVLLASSGYVYGECDPERPATEETPPRPIGPYAESKWRMECAAREARQASVTLLIARAFNHTGPGQDARFAVPSFARQIAAAERRGTGALLRVGDLSPRRDLLDVRDVVRAYRLIVAHGSGGGVCNVAGGKAYSMQQVLEMLAAHARVPVRTEPDPERLRPADVRVSVGSAARLRELAGWRPRIALERTLAETLDYWRDRLVVTDSRE